jgi:hypothetical protein
MRAPGNLIAGLALVLATAAAACGSNDAAPLPRRIERAKVGERVDMGRCGSWISPGVPAAYCAAGVEVPVPAAAPNPPGQIEFTGTTRAGAEGGIAQAVGTLPVDGRIGVKVDSATHGTLVAQGLCGRTAVMGSFAVVRFRVGDWADLRITRVGGTPVILLRRNDRDIAPDREVLRAHMDAGHDAGWVRLQHPLSFQNQPAEPEILTGSSHPSHEAWSDSRKW